MQTQTPTPAYQITAIVWDVPSASTPGRVYHVRAVTPDDVPECDCEASQHPKTQGKCWHVKAARSGLAGKPRCRASVQPTATIAERFGFITPDYPS